MKENCFPILGGGGQPKNNKAASPQDQRAGNWLQVVAVAVGKGEQHPWDEDTYPILWGFTRHLRENKTGTS